MAAKSEVKPISWQQFRWLMEGLEIEQKSIILPAEKLPYINQKGVKTFYWVKVTPKSWTLTQDRNSVFYPEFLFYAVLSKRY